MENNNVQNNGNTYKSKEIYVGSRLSDFEIIKQLGKGSYGTVYTVRSRLDSNTYVMKKMELNHLKESQQRECYREVSILRKVSHPNIIKYYASFLENESLCIIMEYAELGDLYSLIKHYKRHQKYFDEMLLWRISYEILTGLEYLHSNNIIHRDIKCLNLFLSKDHHVKIGDLGVSTISALGGMHCTRVGTPLYLSPELVKQIPYDYKTDIWSFGCSLYHLASLEPPFTGNNLIVLGNNIVKGRPKELPSIYSNDLKIFIDKMLTKKPEKRPSAKEAKDLIPKNILEKTFYAYKNKIEIKSRPFSSVGNRKPYENSNNNNNGGNNINNNVNNKNNENKNNNENNNNVNEKISNNNVDEKNNNIKKENKKDNNIIINNNRNDNIFRENKASNSLDYNINNTNNKYGFENNNNIHNKDINTNKIEEKINEEKKYFKKPNNLGEKSGSLYNVLNAQKGFNFFRNNFSHKKGKDNKTSKNLIYSSNKIINNNSKNNSIKVYSNAFKKDLLDFRQNEKKPQKFSEEEKMQIHKKEEKKPFTTDTNIQLISINNNNIIINSINNNYISNNLNNSDKNNNTNNNKKEIIIKNNHDKKNEQKEKVQIESKLLEKENILFPNLKFNKASSVKENQNTNTHTINANKNFESKNVYNKFISNNKILSQKGNDILGKPKKSRPFSSGQFKANSNRQVASTFNKNLINNEFSLNNNIQKKLNSGRPSTGFKPNFNNNVMNININFFNIDMNRRFLAPEINPLNSNDNENNRDKNEMKKNNKIHGSNINLKDYKNTNEFIFQKLIKAFHDINNQKKLTINDLP